MKFRSAWLLIAALMLPAFLSASSLTGKVTNGTVNKPQGGDDVVLLSLSQGMQEAARTKSAADGSFKFDVPNDGGPHLVRVNHQGANYFAMVPPGTSTADVQVYDSAAKVDGIAGTVNIMRLQATGDSLQVTELYAVKNQSSPPRTQMSDQAFEINLPEGAQIEGSMAQGPGGQPINSAPVPQKEKGRYAFVFPLRPGETRFQVSYRLPYTGQITVTPKPTITYEHLVLMTPASMKFEQISGTFQQMGSENGADVRVSSGLKPGEKLAFKVSGTGQIQDTESASAGQPPANGRMAQRGGPGGGLGAPEETPDPLHKYRWFILGGLAVVLAVGAFWAATRQPGQQPMPAPIASKAIRRDDGAAAVPVAVAPRPAAPATNGNRLLDALKEELFQLELDRHQSRISQQEYDTARAALDVTIQRAAARQSKS